MTATRTIRTPEDVTNLVAFLGDMEMPYSVKAYRGRSLDQNALIHKWFGEIARQSEGLTLMDVKASSNFTYGRPILLRDDPTYAAFFSAVRLTHEQTIKAYKLGYIACTSLMSKSQLNEYMTAMERDYRAEGFVLTDPEVMG